MAKTLIMSPPFNDELPKFSPAFGVALEISSMSTCKGVGPAPASDSDIIPVKPFATPVTDV